MAALESVRLDGGEIPPRTISLKAGRNRPPPDAVDHIAFAANPQVHVQDNRSLAENLPGIAAALAGAHAFSAGTPVLLGPVTLRPVRNAAATREDGDAGAVPKQLDARQMSLFFAAWAGAAVIEAALGGAAEAAFFTAACGWRGVREYDSGSEHPERFPSAPGQLFPVFHALRFFRPHAGARLVALGTKGDAAIGGCVLHGETDFLFLYNLSSRETRVSLAGTGVAGVRRSRLLDAAAYDGAMRDAAWLDRGAGGEAFSGATAAIPACAAWFCEMEHSLPG